MSRTKELPNGAVLHGKLEYKIDKCLGQGGFGITYLATATVLVGNIKQRIPFTIKEFFMQQSCQRQENGEMIVNTGSEETVAEHKKEFLREAERLNKLESHPGIVRVNEIFNQNNTVYYVMEYLGSVNLENHTKSRGGNLGEDEAMKIFRQIAEALRFLHSKKITHLDVKPANIMMREGDNDESVPVLIDFGLAVHYGKKGDPTRDNKMICCSDGYSPLEQYLGITTFSPQADIYALGATLLYMLTGERPPMANEMSDNYLQEKLGGKISKKTIGILRKCMGKLAEMRYASIETLLEEMEQDMPVPAEKEEKAEIGGTRVIGQKKPKKPSTPKPIPSNKSEKKTDPALMKKVGIGIAALIVIAAIVFGVSQLGGSTSETPELQQNTTAVTKDSVATNNSSVESAPEQTSETTATTVPEPTQEQKEEKKPTQVEEKVTQQNNPTKATPEQPVVQPEKPSAGPINLGYATYEGDIQGGKPDGHGTLTFTSTHKIETTSEDEFIANPGDKVTGKFRKGKLTYGKWRKNTGEIETIM